MIEVQELYEVDGDKLWDRMGFMAKGHVDKAEFAAAVLAEYEEVINPEQVEYYWAHNHPVGKYMPGGYVVEKTMREKHGRGWYPMTYWGD